MRGGVSLSQVEHKGWIDGDVNERGDLTEAGGA
jgi:hypothetical protein